MAELTDLQNELLKKIYAASEIIKTISVFYDVSDDESIKIIKLYDN